MILLLIVNPIFDVYVLNPTLKNQEKTSTIHQLKKDLESTKKELKSAGILNNSQDKKIFKLQEEIEGARQRLHVAKEMEKEQQMAAKQERIFFEEQSTQMAKQRTKLLAAYKKQLLLIDNLKRQNVCLEQAKLMEFAEKDFTKLLEWNGGS